MPFFLVMSKISGIGHYYHVALISCIQIFMILSVGHGCGSPLYDCPAPTSPTAHAFQNNLRSLLSILKDRASTSTALFHNTSTGQGRDRVFGRAVCKSNVSAPTCYACLGKLNYNALQLCPNRSDAFLWCPLCSIQYGNWSFFGTLDSRPPIEGTISDKRDIVPDMKQFTLVSDLVETSPTENSRCREQTMSNGASPPKLGVAQCTPDLSVGDCLKCLKQLKDTYIQCCEGKGGWYVVKRSCYIVYDDKSAIYSPVVVANGYPTAAMGPGYKNGSSTPLDGSGGNANGGLSPSPLPEKEQQMTSGRARNLLSAFLGGSSSIFLVIIIGCFLFCILRRKKEAKGTETKDEEALLMELGPISYTNDTSVVNIKEDFSSTGLPMIDLATLIHATNNFSSETKLGEGGFGPVYKGVMRDGRQIAIKRLSKSSGQGLREFKNEIIIIAKLQHKNLVRLLNCCVEGGELLLVYEFLANKSLDVFLFDSTKRVELDWQQRLDIILGIARGVQYLHEDSRLKIIHRDLKASNILLDHEMNPKISDFGMARIFENKQNHLNTCRVVGTYGYMAPEYAMEGIFSVKSDVYSFGVLLLEIISGKRNSGFYLTKNARSLLEHAWQLWCEGKPLDLIDPFVIRSYSANEALRCIHIGLLCVQQDAADRPTMPFVVLMLASASVGLPRPSQPAFLVSRESMDHQSQSSTSRKTCSINEITVTCVEPR